MFVITLRKLITVVMLVVLLIIAVIMLTLENTTSSSPPQGATQVKVDRSNAMQVIKPFDEDMALAVPDFFTEYRLERERLRSQKFDVLREMVKEATSQDHKQQAQETILQLVKEKQREYEMENLIKARGFQDALVVIQDKNVSAVVKTQSFSRDEVIQVAEVISRVTGVRPEDITISAKP